jgi:glutamyl-tRNA(Gln) amidotransferase subunit E
MSQIPEYGTVAARDYAELGFKSGLEIHQQLLTAKKLFCRCPAGLYTDQFDAEILRHMRPTLSELGEYDGTALMEFKTKKQIIYRLTGESVCTYDMDDSPPFELNQEALEIAMEITLLLGLQPVGEIHIARKQYLDGSIPTGFQRTTILGVQGELALRDKVVSILQLGLEEDSCREISDIGHWRTYKTDRLGTPLIEIVTGPDMRTPAEVMEVGQALRRLTRITGKVRTGIGAARQDVNVSVTGGTRVEIKGVSRIPSIGLLTHNEAYRQKRLLEIRDTLKGRGVQLVGYQGARAEVTDLFLSTDYRPISKALERHETLGAILLPGFEDLLGEEIQPGVSFLGEFRDRVRVIACLDGLPNLICSEQLDTGPLPIYWQKVRQLLDGPPAAPMILVWGSPEDVETALNEIEIRAQDALAGIPGETRRANTDGTTCFERILPGPDRMYPDTDLPPIPIPARRWDVIRTQLPPLPCDLELKMKGLGLGDELVGQLIDMRRARQFLALAPTAANRERLAVTLTAHWRYLERQGVPMPKNGDLRWLPEFMSQVPRDADLPALRAWAETGGRGTPAIPVQLSGEALTGAVTAIEKQLARPDRAAGYAHLDYLAGRVKERLDIMVSGRELVEILSGTVDLELEGPRD